MSNARTVTVFATNGDLREGVAFKASIDTGNRIWPATVAEDAAGRNWPIEAQIGEFISRRRRPLHWPGIERQRRLKKKIALSENCAVSIDSRTDDPIDLVSSSETLLPIEVDSGFALKKTSILGVDFESPVEPFIHVRSRGGRRPEKRWRHRRHGMSHARLHKSPVDFRMAIRARLGTDISIIGRAGLGVDGITLHLSSNRVHGARTQKEYRDREQKRHPWQSGSGVLWR
jgi:hypothetical protein